MSYFSHPFVIDERTTIENGKTVLTADTKIALDCRSPKFSKWARDSVEREQVRVARRCGYDEVRLSQI